MFSNREAHFPRGEQDSWDGHAEGGEGSSACQGSLKKRALFILVQPTDIATQQARSWHAVTKTALLIL